MITRFGAAALVGLALSASSPAAPIRFDFGDGELDGGTGVAANVEIDEGDDMTNPTAVTIGGTTITLQGIGPSGRVWGANTQGIGIIPDDMLGMGGQRRIDGTAGEFVYFSFDKDVTIDSVRLGNFTTTTSTSEQVEIAFVSGTDPFGGGSFTLTSMDEGSLDDIAVGVFVNAGTVLSLAASVPLQNGVLWNDVVVTPIPEPTTIAMIGVAAGFVAAFRRRRFEQCRV